MYIRLTILAISKIHLSRFLNILKGNFTNVTYFTEQLLLYANTNLILQIEEYCMSYGNSTHKVEKVTCTSVTIEKYMCTISWYIPDSVVGRKKREVALDLSPVLNYRNTRLSRISSKCFKSFDKWNFEWNSAAKLLKTHTLLTICY